jgi:Skp family chaperone for outer membrane proteins
VLKVNKTPLLAVSAAVLLSLCFAPSLALAQSGQPGGAGGRPAQTQPQQQNPFIGKVVLLDVNLIFKNHERFKAQMNQLKNDADAMDVQMKREEASLKNEVAGLQKFGPGSPEYKSLEEQIARKRADFTIKVSQQRREFLLREASNYNDTYKEIEDEVGYFCQTYGVSMVLRYMSDAVDPDNPDSILANINKPVVWHDQTLNITPYIMKRFQAPVNTANSRPAGGVPNGGNPPRGGNVPTAPFNGAKPR